MAVDEGALLLGALEFGFPILSRLVLFSTIAFKSQEGEGGSSGRRECLGVTAERRVGVVGARYTCEDTKVDWNDA